ncbi:MAG: ATPase [bacterium]|nr:ATPase [bacterium]
MKMSEKEYVYVALIAAPPEKVWRALTTAEFTRQYWHSTRVQSSWKVGSRVEFLVENDEVGCEGEVLVCDPPRELSYTWSFPRNPETKDEAPSRVSFLLEELTQGTKLTVTHDHFPEDSKMYPMISHGWPSVIAGLKTLLETGHGVDFSAET